ncbi:Sulfate transporter/antisigma-factor antagonist STAS [Thiorhodococcus drewsii AZ1]|uniref:Sulfate transporter/antisigma-factor antagonist STAS n=1 Tax=Thiorhodococcus drewsii AZ1 TaxID=765913 RepID=G2DVQ2_9GAMM|nr:STAS domain-containing protein [Thiorhodococcus drewsii]EGV34067.1 Sulfate transporter/antisigma-factor antagonist STAS [Thiorhodococcus drewsii AZ1]
MSILEDDEHHRLHLSGPLTIYEVDEVKERLLAQPGVTLDLSGVTECDGSGLQLLMLIHRDAGTRLTAPSDAVTDILHLCGLSHLAEEPS